MVDGSLFMADCSQKKRWRVVLVQASHWGIAALTAIALPGLMAAAINPLPRSRLLPEPLQQVEPLSEPFSGGIDRILKKQPLPLLARVLSGRTAIALGPNGELLAGVRSDGSIAIWHLKTGQLIGVLPGHALPVLSLAISSDNKILASAGHDKTIKIWDLQSGLLLYTLAGHKSWVQSIAISPDGETLVSGSGDQTVKVWSLKQAATEVRLTNQEKEGRRPGLSTLVGHRDSIHAVALSPRGHLLASSSWDRIKLWDMRTRRELLTLSGQSLGINALAIGPNSKLLASGSSDRTINVWEIPRGKLRWTLTGHMAGVSSVAIAADGKTLVSGGWDNTIRVWDLQTGELQHTLPRQPSIVQAVAITPDGKTLVSGGWGNIIKLWQLQTLQEIRTLSAPSNQPIR